MTHKRLTPAMRRQTILSAAVKLSTPRGYQQITIREVADLAGVSHPLVAHYFPTMDSLRAEVMVEAVRLGVVAIVAQGLGMQDPAAMAAPSELREKAIRWMVGVNV